MSFAPRRLAALACVALAVAWLSIAFSPSIDARVESKTDFVRVLSKSGMWYHEYRVSAIRAGDSIAVRDGYESLDEIDAENNVARADSTVPPRAAVGRIELRITEAQYDALRTGAMLKIRHLPGLRSFGWPADEAGVVGFVRALGARISRLNIPHAVAPSLGSSSGLARVISVHRVTPGQGVRRSNAGKNGALDIIVVEFWSPRLRTLVRTADVVDARSIGDLGPGQILQMHYDARTPRIMRLDDGMRSNVE
jgi:hypothetical protein